VKGDCVSDVNAVKHMLIAIFYLLLIRQLHCGTVFVCAQAPSAYVSQAVFSALAKMQMVSLCQNVLEKMLVLLKTQPAQEVFYTWLHLASLRLDKKRVAICRYNGVAIC